MCVGHGVAIVFCSPSYRPTSVLYRFSSSLVSFSYVCNCCKLIAKKLIFIVRSSSLKSTNRVWRFNCLGS